jgi:hypothetical protein
MPALCDIAIVTITVDPTNDTPIANDDSANTSEDSSVDVLVLDNDTDIDGDTLMVSGVINQSSNGSVVCDSDSCTYTPALNFSGMDSFSYEICDDGTPILCHIAIVTINI